MKLSSILGRIANNDAFCYLASVAVWFLLFCIKKLYNSIAMMCINGLVVFLTVAHLLSASLGSISSVYSWTSNIWGLVTLLSTIGFFILHVLIDAILKLGDNYELNVRLMLFKAAITFPIAIFIVLMTREFLGEIKDRNSIGFVLVISGVLCTLAATVAGFFLNGINENFSVFAILILLGFVLLALGQMFRGRIRTESNMEDNKVTFLGVLVCVCMYSLAILIMFCSVFAPVPYSIHTCFRSAEEEETLQWWKW